MLVAITLAVVHGSVFETSSNYVFGGNYEAGTCMLYASENPNCVGRVHATYPLDAPFNGIAASKKERKEAGERHNGIWEHHYPGFTGRGETLLRERLLELLHVVRDVATENDACVVLQIGKGGAAEPFIQQFLDPILTNLHMKDMVEQPYGLGAGSAAHDKVPGYTNLPDTPFVFCYIGLYARVGENALDVDPGTLLIPCEEHYVGHELCPSFQARWQLNDKAARASIKSCSVMDAKAMDLGEWETPLEKRAKCQPRNGWCGSVSSTSNIASRLPQMCSPKLVVFGNADNLPFIEPVGEHGGFYRREDYLDLIAHWKRAHHYQIASHTNQRIQGDARSAATSATGMYETLAHARGSAAGA